ncbi:RDD family protein [Chitinophaga rhizophila]|uniref:RDD family protein n=1 Tax=Chitinophaga rhizophila TaxID=2866212 RepID=A0ABS7G999_9BACT|nr:RDD family protein [Chitinophaga rhizophila]MBW8684233.1 RDD family protein [Chitinophaga rhizophila]
MQNRFGDNIHKKGLIEDLHAIQYTRRASKADRLVNYIVDYFIGAITGLIFSGVLLFMISSILNKPGFIESDLFVFLWMGLYFTGKIAYYIGFEYGNNGRTIGKMITATRAVQESGAPLQLNDAFIRSLCRWIPLETFSGLGDIPLHDEWSKTMVIKY